MNSHNLKRLILANSRGSVLVLVGLLLVVFIGVAALAIDIGYLSTSKNELQNAADAAALGASRKLGNIYQNMAKAGQNLTSYNVNNNGDKTAIIAVAKDVAFQNKAARDSILIDENRDPSDIQIGVWNPDSDPKFSKTDGYPDAPPNAVKVTAHRDADNASGQITTFFTGIFGIDSVPVSADAIAALSGQSTSEPGELELPVGMSEKWFYEDGVERDWCGDMVKFSPPGDADGCAGWTDFDNPKPTNKVPINDILDGDYPSNASSVGDMFGYNNGVVVSDLFKNLLMKFGSVPEPKAYDVTSIYDPANPEVTPDKAIYATERIPLCEYEVIGTSPKQYTIQECTTGDAGGPNQLRYPAPTDPGNSNKFTGDLRYAKEWETSVVVYDAGGDLTGLSSCTPSGDIAIAGYVRVVLYDVGSPNNPYIYARVSCDEASPEDTRGGGTNYGVLGTIPGLVE